MASAKRIAVALLSACLGLSLVACNGDVSIRGDQPVDSDYIMSAGITAGTTVPFETDVRCPAPLTMSMSVVVNFAATSGGAGPVNPPSAHDIFKVTHYTVSYFNTRTQGNVVGVDVPRPITIQTGQIGQRITTGGTTFTFNGFEVLLRAQKSEPPLNDLSVVGVNGGVPLIATVTAFGHPEDNPNQVATSSFTLDVSAYTSCPDPRDTDGDTIEDCPSPEC